MTDWQDRDIYSQMGNIGSEIGRAMKWKDVNDLRATSAAERALELLDLTLSDRKNKPYLKGIARIREGLRTRSTARISIQRAQSPGINIFYPTLWPPIIGSNRRLRIVKKREKQQFSQIFRDNKT